MPRGARIAFQVGCRGHPGPPRRIVSFGIPTLVVLLVGGALVALAVPAVGAATAVRSLPSPVGLRPAEGGDPNPAVSVDPSSAYVGGQVNVSGSGFLPSAEVELFLNTSTTSVLFAECPTNSSGGFSCTTQIPGMVAGSYELNATDTLENATTEFTILSPFLTLTPEGGLVGSNLTVNGTGFTPNGVLTLEFDGSPPPNGCSEAGGLTADTRGNFTCSFPVPDSPYGDRTIRVNDSFNNATATFDVGANLTLSSTSAVFGQSIEANASGLPASVTLRFEWNASLSLCSGTTTASGTFECTFDVPAAFGGEHSLNLTAGSVTLLPTLDVHPSVTLSSYVVQVGDSVVAYGNGFYNRSNSVLVQWNHVSTLCSKTTPISGAVTCDFRIGSYPGGEYNVTFNQTLAHEDLLLNASLNLTPAFSVSPDAGVVGTTVTLSGNGFGASSTYTDCLQTTDDAYCSSGSSFTTATNGSIKTDTTFQVPSKSAGAYYLVVSLDEKVLDSAGFTVTRATVVLTPEVGQVGSSLNISGSGLAPDTDYNYCFESASAACPAGSSSFESNSTGGMLPPSGVPLSLTVPAVAGGKYHVDISYISDGTATLIGSAPFTVEGNVSSTAYAATVGTRVVANGTGLPGSDAYTVSWSSGPVLCSGNTTANGTLDCSFTVPPSGYGPTSIGTLVESELYLFTLFVLPLLTVTPASGPVGTTVEAQVSGFVPSHSTDFNWTSSTPVCTGTTNASGSLSCPFSVPATPNGAHRIQAAAGASTAASSFDVTSAVSATPLNGTVGSSSSLSGSGFGADSNFAATWNGSVTLCAGLTDAAGNLSCTFHVPIAPGGSTPIVVQQGSLSVTIYFLVQPSLAASPAEGAVGSHVEAIAYGLVPGTTFSFGWNASTTFCSGPSPTDGAYFCNFTVPMAPAGSYDLAASDGGTGLALTFVVEPAFSLSVAGGLVGTGVEVTGNGFDADAPFLVAWNASTPLCSGSTNASGGLNCTFSVPPAPEGSHAVEITERSNSLTTSFRISPSLSISPTSATVGTNVTVTGAGFSASASYAVSWTAGGTLCSGTTNVNGGFACSFAVPAVAAGNYTITGTQGANAPTVSLAVSAAPPPPPTHAATPFPWWIVAVVVVLALVGLLAAVVLRRRRSVGRTQPVRAWQESEAPAGAPIGQTAPVPLNPTPVPEPLVKAPSVAPAAEPADAQPEEDVDAMIARLDRIAEQMFKKKPESEGGAGTSDSESGN